MTSGHRDQAAACKPKTSLPNRPLEYKTIFHVSQSQTDQEVRGRLWSSWFALGKLVRVPEVGFALGIVSAQQRGHLSLAEESYNQPVFCVTPV